uniref:Uncharacterized protein n=1 Tax=Anguilla anguilla TaxID=7936 RepID=A0A0E9SHF7_ANGAN
MAVLCLRIPMINAKLTRLLQRPFAKNA